MKNIIYETDRIKEIMGVTIISEQANDELEKVVMTSIKKAFGKAGNALTQASSSTEIKLANYLNGKADVDETVLNALKNDPNVLKNLEKTIDDVKGFKRLTYLNKIKNLEKRIPSKSVSDLSNKSKTLFTDIFKNSEFSQNEINTINSIADKMMSDIPFYNRISTMNRMEIKEILTPVGQDFEKALTKLNTEKERAAKQRDTKLFAQLDRAGKIINKTAQLLTNFLTELAIGGMKGISGVFNAGKKMLLILAAVGATVGLIGIYFYKKWFGDSATKKIIDKYIDNSHTSQPGSTPQNGQQRGGEQPKKVYIVKKSKRN